MDLSATNIIRILKEKGYATFENDSKNFNLNLVGIRTNDMTSNSFNDHMAIIWKYKAHWNNLTFPITSDPGLYYRENPLNVDGTAILKPGQYRGMWSIGKHQGKYDALRQTGPCTVYRDANRDNKLDIEGVEEQTGHFGINHHKAGKDSTQVDRWSAGCQVQPTEALFNIEMLIFKQSAEIWGNNFTYTLLEEKDFD